MRTSVRLDRVSIVFLSVILVAAHLANEDPDEPEPARDADHDEIEQKIETTVLTWSTVLGHDKPFDW